MAGPALEPRPEELEVPLKEDEPPVRGIREDRCPVRLPEGRAGHGDPGAPRATRASASRRTASSQGARSASSSGMPADIFATFDGECLSSASRNSQPSAPASSRATVVFPDPATPMTMTTETGGASQERVPPAGRPSSRSMSSQKVSRDARRQAEFRRALAKHVAAVVPPADLGHEAVPGHALLVAREAPRACAPTQGPPRRIRPAAPARAAPRTGRRGSGSTGRRTGRPWSRRGWPGTREAAPPGRSAGSCRSSCRSRRCARPSRAGS